MLCGTSELQQLLVNREVFWSKMTTSALVRPPPLRCREKGEMVLQGQADMDSSHGTRSLTGRRFESGDRSDASGCGPLRLDRCAGARGPPARGVGAREPPARGSRERPGDRGEGSGRPRRPGCSSGSWPNSRRSRLPVAARWRRPIG